MNYCDANENAAYECSQQCKHALPAAPMAEAPPLGEQCPARWKSGMRHNPVLWLACSQSPPSRLDVPVPPEFHGERQFHTLPRSHAFLLLEQQWSTFSPAVLLPSLCWPAGSAGGWRAEDHSAPLERILPCGGAQQSAIVRKYRTVRQIEGIGCTAHTEEHFRLGTVRSWCD